MEHISEEMNAPENRPGKDNKTNSTTLKCENCAVRRSSESRLLVERTAIKHAISCYHIVTLTFPDGTTHTINGATMKPAEKTAEPPF